MAAMASKKGTEVRKSKRGHSHSKSYADKDYANKVCESELSTNYDCILIFLKLYGTNKMTWMSKITTQCFALKTVPR